MKVFFLVYDLASGGIERVAVNTFKYIDRSKFDVRLITKYDKREFFDDELESYGGKRVPILEGNVGSGLKRRINYVKGVLRVMRDGYEIGYFNLNAPKDVIKYPLIAKMLGMKYIVIHSHNSSEDAGSLPNRIANKLGRWMIDRIADKKITCSEKAAQWMFSAKTVEKGDFVQVNNGIDTDLFGYNAHTREALRKELDAEDSLILGHVGRFSLQKNHEFLIDIFEQVLKIRPNSTLILLGTGSRVDQIKNYVRQKGLEAAVRFEGARGNVNEYMQAFDAFVLPSLYEGLPVVGIEAQAAGLPCFFSDTITRSTDITGNVEYMSLQKAPEEWAKAIVETVAAYDRKDVSDLIEAQKFDVKSAVKTIENTMWSMCN